MRFEQLRLRVQRAELRVSSCTARASAHRHEFGEAWRRGWSPGRIVIAGLLSGFLVGRAEPLSKVGGTRWLQMLGTVSTMLASLKAASVSEDAAQTADVAAGQAAVASQTAAEANAQVAAGTAQPPYPAPPAAPGATARTPATPAGQAPAPAEAATELSER
jgi:hypothetical protein